LGKRFIIVDWERVLAAATQASYRQNERGSSGLAGHVGPPKATVARSLSYPKGWRCVNFGAAATGWYSPANAPIAEA
jgi:hypothetical protein